MSTEKEQIARFREMLGVDSDAKLAERLGISRAAVHNWTSRGIPAGIEFEVEYLAKQDRLIAKRQEFLASVSPEEHGKGKCLALWLAPSIDAMKCGRFPALTFGETLDSYASLFNDIHLACIERIAETSAQSNVSPAKAFELLASEDPTILYQKVVQRAYEWRHGEA